MFRTVVRISLASVALLVATSPPAAAITVQDTAAASTTAGIARATDGTMWVAEPDSASVAQFSPTGALIARYPISGGTPMGVITANDGKVWVSDVAGDQLIWFDAASPVPTAHAVPVAGGCGPTALTDGGDGYIYFTTPNTAAECAASSVARTPSDGSAGSVSNISSSVDVITDLVTADNKVFGTEPASDAVVRISTGMTPTIDGRIQAPLGANPLGIAATTNDTVWVALDGKLGTFATSSAIGSVMPTRVPSGPSIGQVFDIAPGTSGQLWLTAKAQPSRPTLSRYFIATNGLQSFSLTSDSAPYDTAVGTDGLGWATDDTRAVVHRLVRQPPAIGTPTATQQAGRPLNSPWVLVDFTLQQGVADSVVTVDYGPSTSYGSTIQTPTEPLSPTTLRLLLTNLAPGTTYHYRITATNADGTTTSGDYVFTTAVVPVVAPLAPIRGKVVLAGKLMGAITVISKISATAPVGSTMILECVGGAKKGCGFKIYEVPRAQLSRGTALLTKKAAALKLKPGAVLKLRISKANFKSRVAWMTVRSRKAPLVATGCLQNSKSPKPTTC